VANKLLKRFDAALASYDKALALKPDYPVAVSNRGNVLKELKRYDEALKCYDDAIALAPDYAEAFNNRGMTLNELRRFEDALAAYDKTIALKPGFLEAHVNRGIVLNNLGRLEEAVTSFGEALALKPDHADAFYNRANTLNNLKRYDEAVLDCDRALAIKSDPKYVEGLRLQAKMQICSWNGFRGDSSHLASAIADGKHVAQPFTLLPMPAGSQIQRRCAELFIADRYPAAAVPLWRGERYAHERIRVGYVSGDLREHPVAVLAAGLFEHHDKTRFETIAISFGSGEPDGMTERLKGSFERFFDVRGKGDREIAALLRDLEIDIAVDLNGFTGDARPNIFAERPAPAAVNYLGYAGTLGCNYWDYIVADAFAIPEQCHDRYAEQVVSLPGSFMPNDDSRKISAHTPSRTEAGLPEQGFVFCCFNNSYKLTPDAFDIWMRLLREIAGSVLWLSASNPGAMQNLRAEADKRGVSPERLIFAPRVASNEDHLARVRLADLFLDTLYYNAHTTACDALWAGLPLITHPGETFASRVAGSLLSAVGLPELIAPSLAEYEALALKLAREPNLLADVRQKLARNRKTHPLFDTARFTRRMEAAYRTMWERAQRGEPPQSFAVDPSV
jgi:protein O-GlcNAc transferase